MSLAPTPALRSSSRSPPSTRTPGRGRGGRCAASAALVWATGDDAPATAALPIIDTLVETLDEEEIAQVSRLQPLRQELAALGQQGPERRLLTLWLRQVASENERLVQYFERQGEMDLLERVYVQLQLKPETLRGAAADPRPECLDRPFELREALALDRAEQSWVWVILGDPGAGKTTLLGQRLREAALLPLRELFVPPRPEDGEWASIPGGEFLMGNPQGVGYEHEWPTHKVTL